MSATCHEVALVTGLLPGGRATVTIHRAEACKACAQNSACTTLGGSNQDLELVVDNPLGAQAEDRVVIGMPEASVLKASAVIYLLPAVFLVLGASIGWALAGIFGWSHNPVAVLGSASGLAVGLSLTWLLGRRLGAKSHYHPRMIGFA